MGQEGFIVQDRNAIGFRISELLKKNRIKQKEIAESIGLTEATISRYIRGSRVPNGKNITKIASALHTTTDYLLYGQHKEEDDFYISHFQVANAIKRYAKTWSVKQKTDLVMALFDV